MDNSFQTSFIPKKPIDNIKISNKAPVSLFTTITVSLLILVVVGMIGLFFYKVYLTKQKEILSENLLKARDSFEQETINELELFSKRAEVSKQILNEHLVLSPMFNLIGEITIPSVQYTRFDHQTNEKGEFLVKMDGVALDYKSIALQSDMFNSPKGRFFKNVIFSNLIRENIIGGSGHVRFNVEFNVDPALLSYDKNQLIQPTENLNPETIVPSPDLQDLEITL